MEASTLSDNVDKKAVKHSVPQKILSLFSELTQKDAEKRVKTVLLLVRQVTLSEKHRQVSWRWSGKADHVCLFIRLLF